MLESDRSSSRKFGQFFTIRSITVKRERERDEKFIMLFKNMPSFIHHHTEMIRYES